MSPLLDRLRRPRPAPGPDASDPQVRIVRSACSHLIAYPDAELTARLGLLRDAIAALPAEHGGRLAPLITRLRAAAADPVAMQALQEEYVSTFDQRRKGCLYLTYFSHGDTRRRGMALLGIKKEMREAGFEARDGELPDHLAVVLEFAGTVDPERGERILRAHRPGLELLRLHLAEGGSPWHGVLEAVTSTLPPLEGDEREAIGRLATEGPADEEVGLAGYGVDDGPPASAPMAWDPLGSGAPATGCDPLETAGATTGTRAGAQRGPTGLPFPGPRPSPASTSGASHG